MCTRTSSPIGHMQHIPLEDDQTCSGAESGKGNSRMCTLSSAAACCHGALQTAEQVRLLDG